MNIIAAAHGTYVLDAETGDKIPVIGWAHVQGAMLFPMTAMPFGGLTHGRAVETPDGFVTDAVHKRIFESSGDWEQFIREFDSEGAPPPPSPPSPERVRDTRADEMPVDDAAALAEARANLQGVTDQPVAEKPAAPKPNPREPGAAPREPEPDNPLGRSGKNYSTKSFWKWPGKGLIFEIEGGVEYPKDSRVEKIKRDEFFALRKDKGSWTLVADPYDLSTPASPEPETEEPDLGDDLI